MGQQLSPEIQESLLRRPNQDKEQAGNLVAMANSIPDGNRLGPTLYNRTLRRIGATETEAFDALRQEIRILTAVEILRPSRVMTPDEVWQQLRKQQVKQSLIIH